MYNFFLMFCTLLYKVIFYIQLLLILLAVFNTFPSTYLLFYVHRNFEELFENYNSDPDTSCCWLLVMMIWKCAGFIPLLPSFFSAPCRSVISCLICRVVSVPGPSLLRQLMFSNSNTSENTLKCWSRLNSVHWASHLSSSIGRSPLL